jgi:hypothetical protein
MNGNGDDSGKHGDPYSNNGGVPGSTAALSKRAIKDAAPDNHQQLLGLLEL